MVTIHLSSENNVLRGVNYFPDYFNLYLKSATPDLNIIKENLIIYFC